MVKHAEVNQTLLARNKEHFSQVKVTPFGTAAIQDLMEWSGMSNICQEFMSGKIPEPLRALFDFPSIGALFGCFSDSPLSPAPENISLEEMTAAYKMWPERTAMSPSDRNLSHYKALLVQDEAEKKSTIGKYAKNHWKRRLGSNLDLGLPRSTNKQTWSQHSILPATINNDPNSRPKYNPRKAFVDDFIKLVNLIQASGDHVLIGIDANVELGTERNGIDKIL